jgi:methylase of polypeptide subunit release factors
MRARGLDGQRVAHFLVQCLFCMFAEDEDLLPDNVFTKLLDKAATDTERAENRLTALFKTMRQGGDYGDHDLAWFNGSLFSARDTVPGSARAGDIKTVDIPPLTTADLAALHHAAADMDWRAIDPTIFGTLFERSLDPAARAPLGAHYTDTGTIGKLIEPLITAPLLAEWKRIKPAIGAWMAKSKKLNDKAHKEAAALFQGHIAHLSNFRVLDPACGSGNFLYLALKALRDVEKLAHVEAQEMGIHAELALQTGPHNILGIEINEFAAELARVTVWIGDIQWCRRNGYPHGVKPILKPLDGIEHRDALLNPDGSEAEWPQADVIVGNPPFLGGSKKRGELGDDTFDALNRVYQDRVPGGADLVTYWFEKARAQVEAGKAQRVGLVATQSIRAGSNRKVLARILTTAPIFEAWSDEAWDNNGAAVRVSLVCFGRYPSLRGEAEAIQNALDRHEPAALAMTAMLDGKPVSTIHADLTAGGGLDLTQAKPLKENEGYVFQGPVKVGAFDIPGELARQWLKLPNPNGRPNSDVLRPWANGQDLTSRPSDTWIIDFGPARKESEASLFEIPFSHVAREVRPQREQQNDTSRKLKWWLHGRSGEDLRNAVAPFSRYIATPRVAKHRFFAWLPMVVLPDTRLNVVASDSDALFGILSSRIHEVWSLAQASMHGVGNDPTYNAKSCFETFPFPEGLTPRDTASVIPANAGIQSNQAASEARHWTPASAGATAERIAAAAKQLNALREAWLNPPEWVDWVRTPEEEQAGFPPRPVAKPRPLPNPPPGSASLTPTLSQGEREQTPSPNRLTGEGAKAEPTPIYEAELKKRTLTNLYNARPAWLDHAHRELDAAVAAAYGWADYTPAMPDADILKRLLALNLERAETERQMETGRKIMKERHAVMRKLAE